MKRDIFAELMDGLEFLAKNRQQQNPVARELAPAGLRSSPHSNKANDSEDLASAAQPSGTVRRSDKLPRHR
ncbi:hypothetical protein [Pseudomonas nunensis]|uniref:Uncharacterized protein n=1 Tax=Pseudomonas nunensis TaxID=2961896 RepID=A0ABY5EMI5_9PSED|nr:hypothetical protein [Pseudomonas nunensis]MCL5229260.1 hypothetical protein [Pseudomonas nunensis]MDN3221649.1 hypothetical protein [Pseudomonas nunensis]UTO16005.1 hypothetical protein NK667_06560 [Pseudomonas nunensis]